MTLEEEKEGLLTYCGQVLEERISRAQAELKDYNEQSGEETKSSAGDKYETARAMLHLEKEKIALQLEEALKLKRALNQSKDSRLVKTNKGNFLVCIGIGQIQYNQQDYFVISPVAPIGKLLLSAKTGEKVSFGPNVYEILDLC